MHFVGELREKAELAVIRVVFGLSERRARQAVANLKFEARSILGQNMAEKVRSVAVAVGNWAFWGQCSRSTARGRLRACFRCPVFDRTRLACRDRAGLGLGCGCYMPLKVRLARGACWAQIVDTGGPHGFPDVVVTPWWRKPFVRWRGGA